MLYTLLLLCLCTLASPVLCLGASEQHALEDAYSRGLALALRIRSGARSLLPTYEEQLGMKDSQRFGLLMRGVPSCALNYTDWHSLEDAARLQQNSEYLQVFDRHIDACCSFRLRLGTQSDLALKLLKFNIRDLQVLIDQQLKLLQLPAVTMAAGTPLCNCESGWLGRMEAYVVLRGLETCAQKVVRDYTLLCSQRQQ